MASKSWFYVGLAILTLLAVSRRYWLRYWRLMIQSDKISIMI